MALQECGLNMNATQKELQPHGTAEFPCAGYESRYTASLDDVIPWHWHEEFEAVLIPEGALRLKVLSEAFVIHPGEMALINSGALHYGEADGCCRLEALVFSPLLIAGNEESNFAKNYVTPLAGCCDFSCMIFPASDPLVGAFQNAFESLKHDTFAFEFVVREALSHILLAAYQKYEPSIVRPEKGKNLDAVRLSQMLEFIEAHYAETFTLADLCNAAHIGEREAMRCFKRTVGESPMQYLMKFRLMKSANMLLEKPTMGIAEIAGRCGFDSPSYYAKKFRGLYKCTPREYVKQYK